MTVAIFSLQFFRVSLKIYLFAWSAGADYNEMIQNHCHLWACLHIRSHSSPFWSMLNTHSIQVWT